MDLCVVVVFVALSSEAQVFDVLVYATWIKWEDGTKQLSLFQEVL